MIRVVVTGAYGKMGREVIKTILGTEDMELVGAVDRQGSEEDIGALVGIGNTDITVQKDLEDVLIRTRPDVAVDFTGPQAVYQNTMITINHRVRPVVGTTGMGNSEISEIVAESEKYGVGGVIAPNFAIGALLMIRFASEAVRYFPHVEIIELHHNQKQDAPSGTAIKTAEAVFEMMDSQFQKGLAGEIENIKCARGGEFAGGIRIHSVRLPGLIAHQEVIFGGLGQTLTIRHDSISRESFMPGVLFGIRKSIYLKKVVYGLDKMMFE